jgi:hypothetical protein
MKRNVRRPRLRHGPWQPRCETLEGRLVLSALAFDPTLAPPLSPVQTNTGLLQPLATWPAGTLHQAIDSFAVGFNVALDPAWLMQDLALYRVRGDGTLDADNPVPILTEQLDATDPRWLVASLDGVLEPGHYRVVLSGLSMLMGADGEMLDPTGVDLPLGDFTITTAGTGLHDAIDLKTIGAAGRSASGMLDFGADPAAVSLYRFTLPAGANLWRLGLEVDAQRSGSALRSALSLFDADGHVIATSHAGRPDDPADPYLFAGLASGTYYVGLSAVNNVPGQPGGYDLTTGAAGTTAPDQPGGSFTLHLAADAVTAPTTVIGFRLDHADPTRSLPTGFEIQFSGPITVTDPAGQMGPLLGQGLEVVDASGRAYAITAVGYDEATCLLTYVFDHQPGPGTYTLRLPASGGLTDLAGQPVIRSAAEPAAPLAGFEVAREQAAPAPDDLGPLFAGDMPASGIQGDLILHPGEMHLIRLVTLAPGFLNLSIAGSGGAMSIVLVAPGSGTYRSLSSSPAQGIDYKDHIFLQAGVHLILVRDTSDRPAQVHWIIRSEAYPESLLLNGVGQTPALNLRLVAPTPSLQTTRDAAAPESTPAPPAHATAVPAMLAINPRAVSSERAGSGVVSTSGAAPGGLMLTLTSTPVGLPGPACDQVAAVGPGALMSTLAYDGKFPPTGLILGDAAAGSAPGAPSEVVDLTDGALAIAVAHEVARGEVPGTDSLVPGEAGGPLRPRLNPATMLAEVPVGDREAVPGEPIAATVSPEPDPAEALSLDPVGLVGFLTLAISPFRDRLMRWLGRTRLRASLQRRGRLPEASTRSRPRIA